jgi:hypothetical protein
MNEEEVSSIHERLLRANTKDYGRYDPSPTFSKPPFKLIPNWINVQKIIFGSWYENYKYYII